MAKIMGFSAMERTISGVTSLAPETPMKTSAPRMAPASGPPDAARVRELRELGLVPREALAPGVNGAAAVADDYVGAPRARSIFVIAVPGRAGARL